MMPVSTLYDELSEQKKPVWAYSSFPLKRGRNKKKIKRTKQFAEEYSQISSI